MMKLGQVTEEEAVTANQKDLIKDREKIEPNINIK
jgi:hypothetical protein